MPVAVVRMARSSDTKKTTTIKKPTTTRPGRVRLRSVPESTENSNICRLLSCEPVRCTRRRWASETSHLAVVNSRAAHGLQEPFSAQPRAIARLARKSRSRRFETSRSLILWVTSGAPANGVGSPSDLDELGSLNISITGLRAADRNLLGGGHASGTHHCHSNNKYQGSHPTFLRTEYRRQFLTAGESLEAREVFGPNRAGTGRIYRKP